MKTFRIYYKTLCVATERTPFKTIKARDAKQAVEIFKANASWSTEIVAIFAD